MTSSPFETQLTRLVGATLILLGTAAAPSQAKTKLTGFSTYGDMMSGMRVTAGFLGWQLTEYLLGRYGR
jgi:hypothetical protein